MRAGDEESDGEEERGGAEVSDGDTERGRGLFLTSSFSEEWAVCVGVREVERVTRGCGMHAHLTPHYQLA